MFFAWADLADLLGSRPLLHTFYLLFECASPRKHRVCVVLLFSSAPFPFAHVLFVMWVCFASQTPVLCSALRLLFLFCTRHLLSFSVCFASQTSGLCSASLFSSLPLLHTFVCLPVCFASQTMMLCSAVFPWPLWDFVRLSDLCTLWWIFCIAFFALQASGLRGAFTPFPVTCMISLFRSFPLSCVFECFASQRVFV